MVRIALAMLKHHSPGLRLVVSYADPAQGHNGAIYQAGNWLYTGKTPDDWKAVFPGGRELHSRTFGKHFGHIPTIDITNAQKITTPGKHRYFMPLDADIRQHLVPFMKPYPKRVKDSSEPSVIHAEEGGAAPTHTLQLFPMRERMKVLNV